MPRKTQYTDIVDAGIPTKMNEFFKQIERIIGASYTNINTQAQKIKTSLKKISHIDAKSITTLKTAEAQTNKLVTAKKQLTAKEKDYLNIKKQLEQQMARSQNLHTKEYQQLQKKRKQNQELTNIYKTQAGSIARLRARTAQLVKLRESLNLKTKQGVKVERQYTAAIARNQAQLKRYDAQIGRHYSNVGNYVNSLKQVLTMYISIYAAIRVLGSIANVLKDFDKQTSAVAAILVKTKNEIRTLIEDAKRLGATTAFTATEVAQLQESLARLGFTEKQIIGVTEGILDMAAASRSDLAEAAEVVGQTMRAYDIDISQTKDVVDTMAKSFSTSALNMERFKIAMPYVAAAAKKMNWSLQRTTAMLGILINNGIEASKAGTGLRKIMSDITQKGWSLETALRKVNEAENQSAMAIQLFGRRAYVAGLILSDNIKEIDTYTQALYDNEDAAKKMAKTMLDNVAGDLTILKSTWEGLILSIEDGQGIIAIAARSIIQDITSILRTLTSFSSGDWITYN